MRAIRRFTINPVLPEPLAPLRGLMLNLRWSWHPETRAVFAAIDPAAWERAGGEPAGLLARVSQERLARIAGDRKFLREQRDRLAAGALPGVRVNGREDISRLGMPGPAQVEHQAAQRGQLLGQHRVDRESADGSHVQ